MFRLKVNFFLTFLIFLILLFCPVLPAQAAEKIIASVNGTAIYFKKFESAAEKAINQIKSENQIDFATDEGKKTTIITAHSILEELIDELLIEKEAANLKLTVSSKEIEKKIALFKSSYPDDVAFADSLKAQNITEEELKENIHGQLLKEKIIASLAKDLQIKEEEIKDYYHSHFNSFYFIPEEIETYHILVFSESRGQAALGEIKDGKNFKEAARKYSEDTLTKANGGYLGFRKKEDFPEEIREQVFALQIGEVSRPLKTPTGFEIYKCLNKSPQKIIPYDIAKKRIERTITEEKKEILFEDWFQNLKSKAKIKINEKMLAEFLAAQK